MSLKDKQSTLDQFIGTEGYTRWSPLFRRMVLTDGAKFVADNGGRNGAYWLVDAIASHQPKALKNEMLREIQFWTLVVKEKDGRKTRSSPAAPTAARNRSSLRRSTTPTSTSTRSTSG